VCCVIPLPVCAQDINDESMFEAMAPAEYGLDEFVERVELITGADDTVQVRCVAALTCNTTM
jgi:hypothetical protein